MKIVLVKGAILLLLTACLAEGQTWTETSAPSNNWVSVACSADGSKVIAAAGQANINGGLFPNNGLGPVYVSTNSGTTWNPVNLPVTNWTSVSCSADGSIMAAAYNDASAVVGEIYVSTNYGNTWADTITNNLSFVLVSPAGNCLFACFASDADANLLLTSTNDGASWQEHPTIDLTGDLPPLRLLTCSADGSRLTAIAGYGIFSGTNVARSPLLDFTQESNAPVADWESIASSPDGTKLIAAANGSSPTTNVICISTNSGENWMIANAPSNSAALWDSVAISADGTRMAAMWARFYVDPPVPVYLSTNSGGLWMTNNVPNATPRDGFSFWSCVASSADGGVLYGTVYEGEIWTLQTIVSPRLNVEPSSQGIDLSWIIPSTNFVLNQSADLNTWTCLTNSPSLNYSNAQEQLTLSATNSCGFYRLVSP